MQQRTATIGVGVLFISVLVLLATLSRPGSKKPVAGPTASASSKAPSTLASADFEASTLALDLSGAADAGVEPGFDVLPDGSKVPPLPDSAPQQVRFGVILIGYKGAQQSPNESRTKDDARARAVTLIPEAEKDFAAAAAKGDRGSTADAGRIPRGVLEPAPEYVLFTLSKGQVASQPIDTPRGYWVVRRSD